MHVALVADGTVVLVDAEDDQHEFGCDAREHDADEDAGDRGQQHQRTTRAKPVRRRTKLDSGGRRTDIGIAVGVSEFVPMS